MKSLAFERAGDEGTGESLTHTCWLRIVKVATQTARPFLHQRQDSAEFVGIRPSVLFQRQNPGVVDTTEHDERADLELTCKPIKPVNTQGFVNVHSTECFERNQKLGSDLITPTFYHVNRSRCEVCIR